MNIYVQKDGQQRGPFSESTIREGIETGRFRPDDLAMVQKNGSWQPFSNLLAHGAQSQPPVPKHRSGGVPMAYAIIKLLLLSGLAAVFYKGCVKSGVEREDNGRKALEEHYQKIHDNRDAPSTPYTSHFVPPRSPLLPPPSPFSLTTPSSPKTATPKLRSSKDDFIRAFGQPEDVIHNAPPDDDVAVYRVGAYIMRVGCWHGVAHSIAIFRADKAALTQGAIEERLDALAENQDWIHDKDPDGEALDRWMGNDAVAFLTPIPKDAPTTTSLRIFTKEFVAEFSRLNPSE